ncbi:LacI family DNA-binding transcriptional regulator [Autumnicola edwardsiae]|uniref:LacI family DNA-binding transcriptional regulator n=1 Tax=Autumnicola edwardsiae TaxID=3075594 RepID=A0ABU3CT36_9FLAO|nr:LacI family DNA-binding transcriptional regulator [Zunongwangia sp. F297]MDT0649523.1 LacI family DNA-binding transcriptional regulator [Zunongwangia sp. F297]
MSGKEKVTIYDISKKLNISAATVSRALNQNPKISEKTRELVAKTALEMNYKQNRLAQALKSGKTNNVGVIVPYINRSFFSSVIRGIEEELTPHGYHVIICQSHEEVKNEINQLNALLNTQIDGIFMSVSKTTQNTDHIKKALEEHTPLVFFDRKIEMSGVSSVVLDDFKAGYMATEHLIMEGCKKIAHLSGDINLEIYKNRFEGYRSALEKHGLTYHPEHVIQTNSKIESGQQAVAQLWECEEKPDAIFSAGDYAALGAIQELKSRNIRIPEDVCVVGFSNEPFTKYMELPITSMDQTPLLMGKIAAQVFLEQVKGNKTLTIEKKVVLSPELFVRSSSGRSILQPAEN